MPQLTSRPLRLLALAAVAALVALTVPGVALAQEDPALAAKVESKLARRHLAEGVEIYAAGGRVILEGTLPTLADVQRAEHLAAGVKGVAVVDNRLRPAPRIVSDQLLGEEANLAIVRYPNYGIFDWVWANAENGTVTLYGSVYRPTNRSSLERAVADIAGVGQVVNHIQVLPVSGYDDQLRAQAARSIYGSLDFVQLGLRPNPPIHIIVHNGRIQLVGVVNTLVEKRLAESRVRHATLAFGVRNDLIAESSLRG